MYGATLRDPLNKPKGREIQTLTPYDGIISLGPGIWDTIKDDLAESDLTQNGAALASMAAPIMERIQRASTGCTGAKHHRGTDMSGKALTAWLLTVAIASACGSSFAVFIGQRVNVAVTALAVAVADSGKQ